MRKLLNKNEKVKPHMKIKIHELIDSRFWN